MSGALAILRIRIDLGAEAQRCEWVLLDGGRQIFAGAGLLTALPEHDGHVELVLRASDVLITRRQLPFAARRQSGALLAYAVEDMTAGDPQANQVSWLGADAAGMNSLAVLDKAALQRWRSALAAVGINRFELLCETLLLPWTEGTWSVAWGCEVEGERSHGEGFVRTGQAEGGATDCGDEQSPPLSLELLLTQARAAATAPASIALYTCHPDQKPDLAAWSKTLGLVVHYGGHWSWASISDSAGPALVQQRQRWHLLAGMLPRLRPAFGLLTMALLLQGLALIVDQIGLGSEQRELRAQMEARFRGLFPEAVAVVDPVLQMRRQLTTQRQRAGVADGSDFLPLLELVALATRDQPVGVVRKLSWENGRMSLEFSGVTESAVPLLLSRLREAGLRADVVPATQGSSTLIVNIQTV